MWKMENMLRAMSWINLLNFGYCTSFKLLLTHSLEHNVIKEGAASVLIHQYKWKQMVEQTRHGFKSKSHWGVIYVQNSREWGVSYICYYPHCLIHLLHIFIPFFVQGTQVWWIVKLSCPRGKKIPKGRLSRGRHKPSESIYTIGKILYILYT